VAELLSEPEIAAELAAYNVVLPPKGLTQLRTYLELLVRWNRRINLTGLREPRDMVRRLFGESLFLTTVVSFRGWLVDVGSGAGFPGLALKLALPELRITLVEARRKRAVFLQEVARTCQFANVEVVAERFETLVQARQGLERPAFITTRAVNINTELLSAFRQALGPGGVLVSQTTREIADRLVALSDDWKWAPSIQVPNASSSVIVTGTVK